MPRHVGWRRLKAKLPALAAWVMAWALMLMLDRTLDLANLALVLVLAAAAGGLWLNALESVGVCALAVLAFNWQFVPPRGTFSVDLRLHAWLLLTMLTVGSMVAWLTARQRQLAQAAQATAEQAELLRTFGDRLLFQRSEDVPVLLAQTLHTLCAAQVCVAQWGPDGEARDELQVLTGQASPEEQVHLRECLHTGKAAQLALVDVHGYQSLALPMRGQGACTHAVLLRMAPDHSPSATERSTAQALCNQAALHVEHLAMQAHSYQAQQEAQTQKVRNTLLAAISHDYRTPLATIMGAATSLLSQARLLRPEQSRALAQTIVDEVQSLNTLTDNTLQLARLDASGVPIRRDWESLEELVGTAVASARSRYPQVRLHLRMAADLPLLRCDATLVVQLLFNLVDNAVKYGPPGQTIEIVARSLDQQVLLAVADRGKGIGLAERERIFGAFERGEAEGRAPDALRGVGLGLALCRSIVRAHGGSIVVRMRQRGGTSMECRFPLEPQPAQPALEGN